ncbi:ATP-grasp domain-containing protein [Evansella clarkii]|uniref:ATP-grasp domain-containing protein n=1 Tax=Evansella clarkii TaxID=79879 RepID=UPI000B433379|nr:ATP-grasp domain-containing protein [Evansella clarkii]
MNHVLVFGGSVSLLEYLNNERVKYTVILSKDDSYDSNYLKNAETVHVLSYSNYAKLLCFITFIVEKNNISAILCLVEKDIPLASKIAKELNFYFISEKAAKLSYNKMLMRQSLKNVPELNVDYDVVNNLEELDSVLLSRQLPVILKPLNREGSLNIIKINKQKDLSKLVNNNKITKEKFPFLIEEFLIGEEFSVETFSVNGKHYIIGITEKIKDDETFIEYGHVFPAHINEKKKYEIVKLVTTVLNKINLLDGPGHTEIIYTKQGPKLVETHTRFGGDNIVELIKLSTGINLSKEYIRLFVDKKLPSFVSKQIRYLSIASIRYFKLKNGYLNKIKYLDNARGLKNVKEISLKVAPENYIKQDSNSFDRKGYAIMCGESKEDVEETWSKVCSIIEFDIQKER